MAQNTFPIQPNHYRQFLKIGTRILKNVGDPLFSSTPMLCGESIKCLVVVCHEKLCGDGAKLSMSSTIVRSSDTSLD